MKQLAARAPVPRLLVSVRNAREVSAALNGGCDILDVKEPVLGSLGMASVETISSVVNAVVGQHSNDIVVSAALGEARDWTDDSLARNLDTRLSYLKLGLSGLGRGSLAIDRWRTVRRSIDAQVQAAWSWIAVAYADWQQADSPPPEEVIDAAAEEHCAGVLFDTFCKDGTHLLNWLTAACLREYAGRVRQRGMLAAIAGGLQIEHLETLGNVPADVIAIRSAACASADRADEIDADCIARFQSAMRNVFAV